MLGWFALPVAVVLAAVVFTGIYYYSQYTIRASKFDLSKIGELKQRSAVYDMHGEFYSHLPGMNRQIVPLDKVNGWFIQALLAREDSTFWTHKGVEPKSVVRAALANFRGGGIKQGASTLTQQLARNALELSGRSYDRKATEAALAMRIEKEMSKPQILEAYVNRIYFGAGFYGVEAASRGYFGKPAADLTLGESAMLAGLICSPNKYSPARNMNHALVVRDEVLGRMLEEQMVTPELVSAAKAAKIELTKAPAFPSELDYVTDAVIRSLGEVLDGDVIERGGLKVFCTIDPQLQKNAEAATDRQMTKVEEQKKFPHPKRAHFEAGTDEKGNEKPTEYIQAAVVVIDNKTGAIRACVGGRDYNESKYQRALISYRQIGSTFKPFVFAAAFERGMSPETPVSDDKILPNELQQVSNKWSPENSDGEYTGVHPASWGLIKSRNTMSVRVGQAVGLPGVRKLANQVGIGERMPNYPVAFLGAFETTLRDLTAAYAAFPNGGTYRPPFLIAKVENDRGEVIYRAEMKDRRAMSSEAAWMTTACLQEVMRSGTASKAAQLGWKKPGAGKTGTTNDYHDAWFVGYTSSLTCGVWVGMDKPQTIMEKGYGGALALPVWIDVLNSAPEQAYPAQPFVAPVQTMKARLCAHTGVIATQGCEHARTGYDAELPVNRVPRTRCSNHPDPLMQPPQTFAYGGMPTQTPPPASGAPLQPFNAQTPPAATPPPTGAPTPEAQPAGTPGYHGGSLNSYRVVRTPSGLQIYSVNGGTPAPQTPQVSATPPAQTAQAAQPPVTATRPSVAATRPAPPQPTAPRTVAAQPDPAYVAPPRGRTQPQPALEPTQPRYVQPDSRLTTRNRQPIGRDGLTDEERSLLRERRIGRNSLEDEGDRRSFDQPRVVRRGSSIEETEAEPPRPSSTRSRGGVVVRRAVPAESQPRVSAPRDLEPMVEEARPAQPQRRSLFGKPLFSNEEDD